MCTYLTGGDISSASASDASLAAGDSESANLNAAFTTSASNIDAKDAVTKIHKQLLALVSTEDEDQVLSELEDVEEKIKAGQKEHKNFTGILYENNVPNLLEELQLRTCNEICDKAAHIIRECFGAEDGKLPNYIDCFDLRALRQLLLLF
jgi:hypothetical protein